MISPTHIWTAREHEPQYRETSTGVIVPVQAKRSRPIGIDLFAGAGGFSLGFMQAGFEVVAAAEHDVTAMHTYLFNLGSWPCNIVFVEPGDRERAEKGIEREFKREGFLKKGEWTGKWTNEYGRGLPVSGANRPFHLTGVSNFFLGDIAKLTGERILRECGLAVGDLDCLFGGPPCQGFSTAGKQDIMDPRNSLVFEFMRLVLELRPKTLCFENVPAILNMVTPEGMPVVDAMCQMLEEGDYGRFQDLKKAFLVSSGSGAMMRGRVGKPGKKPKKGKTAPQESAPSASSQRQASFLDEVPV